MSTLPSGVRLVALLNDHLGEIMGRERANHTSMHLYCTGPYWVAFERSAYQLRRAFPDSETTPMRLLGYPFPVVMVSVTDRSLRSYARKHILRIDEPDYKRLTVPVFPAEITGRGTTGRYRDCRTSRRTDFREINTIITYVRTTILSPSGGLHRHAAESHQTDQIHRLRNRRYGRQYL